MIIKPALISGIDLWENVVWKLSKIKENKTRAVNKNKRQLNHRFIKDKNVHIFAQWGELLEIPNKITKCIRYAKVNAL